MRAWEIYTGGNICTFLIKNKKDEDKSLCIQLILKQIFLFLKFNVFLFFFFLRYKNIETGVEHLRREKKYICLSPITSKKHWCAGTFEIISKPDHSRMAREPNRWVRERE